MTWEEWRQQSYKLSGGRIGFPENEDVMRRDYPITYYYFVYRVPPIDYQSNLLIVYSDRGKTFLPPFPHLLALQHHILTTVADIVEWG
jgi:hypothetical protein